MTKEDMQAWHDEKMRDLAEVETRICRYLHQLENTASNDDRRFDNAEILLGMQCFEVGIGHVALYVARQLAKFNAMGEAAGSA